MACFFSVQEYLVLVRRKFAIVQPGKSNSCDEKRLYFLGSRSADHYLVGSLRRERCRPSSRVVAWGDSDCLKLLSIDLFKKKIQYLGIIVFVPSLLPCLKPTPKPTPRPIPAMTTSNSVATRIDLMDLLCGLPFGPAFVSLESKPPRLLGLWCSSGTASGRELS